MGHLIYPELSKLNNINLYVIDRKGKFFTDIHVFDLDDKLPETESACIYCSLLHEGIMDELKDYYPEIPKFYADCIFDYSNELEADN